MRQINESIKMKIFKRNKLIYGVGVNDADYFVNTTVNGKQVKCLFYQTWIDMLTRCYSEKYQNKRPTYIGCTVSDCWLVFSNFKKWMELKDFKGKRLDKDLKFASNRVYSPDKCMFVTCAINNLLTNHAAKRGLYPQGVDSPNNSVKYRAQISFKGKFKHLGFYTTVKSAEMAYLTAKHEIVKQAAIDEPDQEVSQALHMQAGLIFNKLQVVGALD